jgi:hypothetical protein
MFNSELKERVKELERSNRALMGFLGIKVCDGFLGEESLGLNDLGEGEGSRLRGLSVAVERLEGLAGVLGYTFDSRKVGWVKLRAKAAQE